MVANFAMFVGRCGDGAEDPTTTTLLAILRESKLNRGSALSLIRNQGKRKIQAGDNELWEKS